MTKYTFSNGWQFSYEFNEGEGAHRLVVSKDGKTKEGPWEHGRVITFETNERPTRYFVAQRLTDLLPPMFEVLPPREIILHTA